MQFRGFFDVVQTKDVSKVVEYLRELPQEERDTGGPVRVCGTANVWVVNYKGSAHILDKKVWCTIEWEQVEDGVRAGKIPMLRKQDV